MALLPPLNSGGAATKLVPRSQLERQKNGQGELRCAEEERLPYLCAPGSRSCLSGLSVESRWHSTGHGGLCSAGLQSEHLSSQTKTLLAKPVARQKEGVDCAYPLKPISHKGVSVPVVNAACLGSFSFMEEAPKSRTSPKNKEKPPAGRSPVAVVLSPRTAEPKEPACHLQRRNLAYILKLEEDRQIMEKEIQKKKAVLREKLMRAEEVLRRIQRERELVEAEERRYGEAERTYEQKAVRRPKEQTLSAAVGPGDGVFSGTQSAIPKPSTTLHPEELDMETLKKEWLLASNSKIQDHRHMEHLASHSKLAPIHGLSPFALSDQVSGDHLSTEGLYLQDASAVEERELGQCSFCGRNFLRVRLEKHMSICCKTQGSKRKVFDFRKARARGTILEEFQQWKMSERPQFSLS
ncbi:zinc finger C2HC domain-containing protein 1C isoform X1 [Phaenicophaeus curvirostris]|uniref:zinc finger C2HC domain-containing protein 1C isoform X1 n=1 Tax=Phaenicophaeus curvirostris TaxID=33595 RepID=UPI0037F0C388